MSRVYVLAADRKLPLCDFQQPRTSQGLGYTITFSRGFAVKPLNYYRHAVEELGYPMKPFRYEFSLKKEEAELEHVRTYLVETFSPGENLELWNVWLNGDLNKKCPPRFHGRLEDFDMETLDQFLTGRELCFSITI